MRRFVKIEIGCSKDSCRIENEDERNEYGLKSCMYYNDGQTMGQSEWCELFHDTPKWRDKKPMRLKECIDVEMLE